MRYEFTGHETELNTGLIYAGARFLDPVSGMFLTQDPAAQYLNPYAYGPWDPVNGTDPTGMIFEIFGFLLANLWWIAPVAGAVASFAQALANGAGFTQALGAAAVGAGIGLVTGGILGGIGEAITNEALKHVYATALIAAGVGNTAHGFAEGQAITASVGAAMLALGLVAGFTQGRGTSASGRNTARKAEPSNNPKFGLRYGIADARANPTHGELIGDLVLNAQAETLMAIFEHGSKMLRSVTSDWLAQGGRFELHSESLTDPRTGLATNSFGMAVRGMPHHPIMIGPRAFVTSIPGIGQGPNFGEFLATVVHELGHSVLNLSDVYSVNAIGMPMRGGLTAQQWESTQMGILRGGM